MIQIHEKKLADHCPTFLKILYWTIMSVVFYIFFMFLIPQNVYMCWSFVLENGLDRCIKKKIITRKGLYASLHDGNKMTMYVWNTLCQVFILINTKSSTDSRIGTMLAIFKLWRSSSIFKMTVSLLNNELKVYIFGI